VFLDDDADVMVVMKCYYDGSGGGIDKHGENG